MVYFGVLWVNRDKQKKTHNGFVVNSAVEVEDAYYYNSE